MSEAFVDSADAEPGATAARPTGKVARTGAKTLSRSSKQVAPRRFMNPFAALLTYLRQVVAELRKVIWPSRQTLVKSTIIVVLFMTFMTALIYGLDIGFVQGVKWLFT